MRNESNHMDEWMKGSAEMGSVPFNEADWQHMKELLQSRKKRRFIIWWWLAGLLIAVSVTGWFLIKQHNDMQPKILVKKEGGKNPLTVNEQTDSARQNKKLSSSGQTNIRPVEDTEPATGATAQDIQKNKVRAVDIYEKTTVVPGNNTPHEVYNGKSTNNYKILNRRLTATTGKKNVLVITGNQDSTQLLSSAAGDKQSKIKVDQDNFHVEIKRGSTDSSQDKMKADSNTAIVKTEIKGLKKMGDTSSIVKTEEKNDTVTTKKTGAKKIKRKPQLFLSGMYMAGKIPVKSTALGAELLLSIPLGKKFSVSTSLSTAKLRLNEQQRHVNIKSITPIAGTTFILVDKKETVFTPVNGTVATAGLSVGYKAGKWKLDAGIQRGVILNKDNKINSVVDTFYSYTTATLPPGLKVGGGNYNANSFNGKQFLAMNLGMRYYFGRWHAGFAFMQQTWYNKLEGVTTGDKKRTAFNLVTGIRL